MDRNDTKYLWCLLALLGAATIILFLLGTNEHEMEQWLPEEFHEVGEINSEYNSYDNSKLKTMAEVGDANAQYMLAVRYQKGKGVEKDSEKFLIWSEKSAAQNNAGALNNLGTAYWTGEEYPQDDDLAAVYFRASALQGSHYGMYNLAMAAKDGRGIKKNMVDALKWFKRATYFGNDDAPYRVGVFYSDGDTVPQDYLMAAKWYRLSARRGSGDAQDSLAWFYQFGYGVSKNNSLAYMWHDISADNGGEYAEENLENIKAQMTIQETAEALRLEAICVESNLRKCGDDLLDRDFLHETVRFELRWKKIVRKLF